MIKNPILKPQLIIDKEFYDEEFDSLGSSYAKRKQVTLAPDSLITKLNDHAEITLDLNTIKYYPLIIGLLKLSLMLVIGYFEGNL